MREAGPQGHRAALLGADLFDVLGRPGGPGLSKRRTEGSARCRIPHPAACCCSATVAAVGVLLPTAVAGVRPDALIRTVTLCSLRSAPLGELDLT